MNEIPPKTDDEEIMEVAADWFDRQSELSAGEREEFQHWLETSPAHARAYGTVRQAMLDPALLEAIAHSEKLHTNNEAAPSLFSKLHNAIAGRLSAMSVRTQVALAAGSAAMVALVVGVAFTIDPRPQMQEAQERRYATQIGKRDEHILSDQSKILMEADTALAIKLSETKRYVSLDKGEAVFEVSKEPARPFQVAAGSALITVTGTKFSVGVINNVVDVRVFEGSVIVGRQVGDSLNLTGGERALIDSYRGVAVSTISDDALATWESGWIETDAMALSHVVARLNRYTTKPIIISSEELKTRAVYGRFRLDSPDDTITRLSALFDLDVERTNDAIIIKPRS